MFLKLKNFFSRSRYSYIGKFYNDIAMAKKDGQWGVVDKTGKAVIECKYDGYDAYTNRSQGLILVNKDYKVGFVDKSGKEVVECTYDFIGRFYDDMAAVKKDGKWGLIDVTGKEIIECKYDNVWGYDDGLAGVEKDGKWGFVDMTGKEVIGCKYDRVSCFSDGLAHIQKDGKWGCVDKTGEEVVECKYDGRLILVENCNFDNFKEHFAYKKDIEKAKAQIAIKNAKDENEIELIKLGFKESIEKLVSAEGKFLQDLIKDKQAKEAFENAKKSALSQIDDIANCEFKDNGDDYE